MTALRKPLFWFSAILLIVLWLLLYLPHLRTSPGWYGDETLTHHTSLDLARGVSSNMALYCTFWHPHYPYQPLYSLINGLFARAAGGDLVGSRFFNALLALVGAFSIWRLGGKTFGAQAALFSACMFLAYEQTIIHYRMSYAHNAAGLGFLIMTLYLLRRPSQTFARRAGFGLMIAAGAHPLFIHGAITGLLCRWKRPRTWFWIVLPSAIYLVISMAIIWYIFRDWLWQDLAQLKYTFTSRGVQDGGGFKGFENFSDFISQDWFHLGMLAGMLLCIALRKFAAPVVGLTVLFLLVKNRGNLIQYYYQAMVILPVLCLGWAGLHRFFSIKLRRLCPRQSKASLLFFVLPLALAAKSLPASWNGTFRARNFHLVTQSTDEVEAAAKWLNERTNSSDVVAANANIAWLLHANSVPYLQMITWYGLPTQGYENRNRRERFRFNASLENCKFAVIGDIDARWMFGEPNVYQIADQLKRENWPVVWHGKFYSVVANPRFLSEPLPPAGK